MKTSKILVAVMMALLTLPLLMAQDLVRVDGKGFTLRGKPYKFIGTNIWYAPILASEGQGGDRKRLSAELDSLKALGMDNLRILVGAEGMGARESHIQPQLQTEPGVYNDTLLRGLDYLINEMEKRDMRGVFYLTNAWEWSGGFSQYLEWAGYGRAAIPSRDGYKNYCQYTSQFMLSKEAQDMFADHVRRIVGRRNSITGLPYSKSPAIMSWQIANEPRCFNADNFEEFYDWLISAARLIKSIDPNHLVSTGSEGSVGCELDLEMWKRIHNSPEIDYANIHLWPTNWQWVSRDSLKENLPRGLRLTEEYIREHRQATDKPIVLEEFGFPRDSMATACGTPVTARDKYYNYILNYFNSTPDLAGVNFWGWGGSARPQKTVWELGQPYTCDPAHEPQGIYSVFDNDTTTVRIIRNAIRRMKAQTRPQ